MMMPLLPLLLTGALYADAAPAPGARRAERPTKQVVAEHFELQVPAGWFIQNKDDGVILTIPQAKGLEARIIARYVRPGHALYAEPQAYMTQLTKPPRIPLKGWKNGPLEKINVNGHPALRLQRDMTEFFPPEGMSAKEVAMRDEHIAVPAPAGFYLLIYRAPRSIDAAQRKVFREVVKSFKPKVG